MKQVLLTPKLSTIDEIEDVLELALCYYNSSDLVNDYSPSEDRLRTFLKGFLVGPRTQYLPLGLYDQKKLVGGLGGVCTESPFADIKIAQELFWYIEPEYASLKNISYLFDGYEYWAKLLGATEIRLSQMINNKSKIIERLYRRRGYTNIEQAYRLIPNRIKNGC